MTKDEALAALRNLYRSFKRRAGNAEALQRPFMSREVPGWIYDPKSDQVAEAIGDAPIEPHLSDMMNAFAQGMDEMLNPSGQKYGFAILVFPFGDGAGRFNYISNAQRADMIVALKEQLARLEGQPEMVGRA